MNFLCFAEVQSVPFRTMSLLLMNLIKHHAWQSKKLTLWEPGGYRFNFSWISRTTIIPDNNVPQSWGRVSSALMLSLPQLTWLSNIPEFLRDKQTRIKWFSFLWESAPSCWRRSKRCFLGATQVMWSRCTEGGSSSLRFRGPSWPGLRQERISFQPDPLVPNIGVVACLVLAPRELKEAESSVTTLGTPHTKFWGAVWDLQNMKYCFCIVTYRKMSCAAEGGAAKTTLSQYRCENEGSDLSTIFHLGSSTSSPARVRWLP